MVKFEERILPESRSKISFIAKDTCKCLMYGVKNKTKLRKVTELKATPILMSKNNFKFLCEFLNT